jgi:hypothetical protein
MSDNRNTDFRMSQDQRTADNTNSVRPHHHRTTDGTNYIRFKNNRTTDNIFSVTVGLITLQ